MYPSAYTPPGLIAGAGRIREAIKALTLTNNNQTASQVVFTVTGSVLVLGVWAEVTTIIGANHTAAHLRLNDQGATIDITLNTGITLSGLAVGTLVFKGALTAAALTLKSNAAGFFAEPASAGQPVLSPFIAGKKTAAVTTIDYRYTTTDAPHTGVLTWHALWLPLSGDGNLA